MNQFLKFTRLNLGYTLLVIVWGAYVRATGSGAGCGDHWPLCNGEIIPRAQKVQTWIEFAHRASSGISLVLVISAFFWARRVAKPGSAIRKVAVLAFIAIVLEALLGAGLVLLKLVEFDQSVMRAISISLHLVNTLFLLAILTTLSWAAQFKDFFETRKRIQLPRDSFFIGAVSAFILIGVTGAIAALGDTLFPATNLTQEVLKEFLEKPHFLVQLRIFHPVMAIIGILSVFLWSKRLEVVELMPIRSVLLGLIIGQFILGVLNWVLLAPNVLQLIHLLVADLVFIALWISGLKHEARESRLSS